METPLDVGEAEPWRCLRRAGSFLSTWRCLAVQTIRFRPSAPRATIRPRHRCLVLYPHSFAGIPDAARGVSCCGTFVPVSRVTVWFWSGIRTRDSRFMRPMLYPTELSSGGRTGFEPVANGMRRCSTSELSSARANTVPGPRHTPRQCRAHRVGDETHAAVDRSRYLRIGASSKAPIRVRLHPSPPAPKHQGAARPCACAAFPASGQQCPDASGARCNRV